MDSAEGKKNRAVNFTVLETDILIQCVRMFSSVLENKRTDAVSNEEKNNAWENVALTFNAQENVKPRDVKSLKLKYKNLKNGLKRKRADEVHEARKTGGGKAPKIEVDSSDAILEEMLGSQISGNPSAFDDDADDYYDASQIQVESVLDEEYIFEVAENEIIHDEDSRAILPGTSTTSTNMTPHAENEIIHDEDSRAILPGTSTSTNVTPPNFNKTLFPKDLRKAPSTPLLTRKKDRSVTTKVGAWAHAKAVQAEKDASRKDEMRDLQIQHMKELHQLELKNSQEIHKKKCEILDLIKQGKIKCYL